METEKMIEEIANILETRIINKTWRSKSVAREIYNAEIWKINTNNSLKRFVERLKQKIYSSWRGRQLGELLCDIDETLKEFVEVD